MFLYIIWKDHPFANHHLAALCVQKTPKVDFSENDYFEPSFEFYDKRLLERVVEADPYVHEFFTLLALCHTVMSEQKDGGSRHWAIDCNVEGQWVTTLGYWP